MPLPDAPEWQRARVERRRLLCAELYTKLNEARKAKRPRDVLRDEDDDDDDGVSSAQLHSQQQPLKRNGGCGYWYGYVARPRHAVNDSSVQVLHNPHFDGWDPAVVREWLRLQNNERGIPDDVDALAAFADYFAHSVISVLTSVSGSGTSRRDELLASLPLVMGPSLRRSRLVLGAVVPGTRGAGGSVQMLPCYTRNLRPLVFLRGVLRDVLDRAVDIASTRVRQQLADADEALRRIGVTQAMRSPCLEAFESDGDPTLAAGGKRLDLLREWCVLGEHVVQSRTLLTAGRRAAGELYEHVEWLVHLPQLFESYIKLRLRQLLESIGGVRYSVTKPRARTVLPHFPDQAMYPDILVREATGDKAIRAVYDAKLYRSGYQRHIEHMHQVEAYCAGLEASQLASAHANQLDAARGRTIKRAGLIYGYWATEPGSESECQRRKRHRGCYFIDLRGNADAVEARLTRVLQQVREDFEVAVARGDLDDLGDDNDGISSGDDDEEEAEEEDEEDEEQESGMN